MLRKMGLFASAIVVAAGLIAVPVATAASGNQTHPPASALAPYCGITWGSMAKNANPVTAPELTNIRAGRHDCYDRLVLDVRGQNVTGYWVQYVTAVTEDGSGHVVPVRGGAKLSVSLQAQAYDAAGRPTYRYANRAELVNVSGYTTFRQVAWAGSFEGMTTVGLGVRARLPFRVLKLPGRLVIDVAHHW